jgi:hypothetical protein
MALGLSEIIKTHSWQVALIRFYVTLGLGYLLAVVWCLLSVIDWMLCRPVPRCH